jgi:hypothetical protein
MAPPHSFFNPKTSVGSSTSRFTPYTSTSHFTSQSSSAPEFISSPESEPGLRIPELRKDSTKSSWIWDHGHSIPGFWKCMYCSQTYSSRTTSNQQKHLREIHQVQKPSDTQSAQKPQQRLNEPRQVDSIRLRELLATWLIEQRHAFTEVESKAFRDLVAYLNPVAIDKLPKSGNTCRADIMKCFQRAKATIRDSLRNATFRIHLCFDM